MIFTMLNSLLSRLSPKKVLEKMLLYQPTASSDALGAILLKRRTGLIWALFCSSTAQA